MPTPYVPIKYRRNPQLLGNRRGRKTQDEQSGFWTYENFLVEDDYGTLVDGRDSTFDRDRQEGQDGLK